LLVVASSISTLAAADAVSANTASPRFATGLNSHLSLSSTKSTATPLDAFSNHAAAGTNENFRVAIAPIYHATPIVSSNGLQGTIRFRAPGWTGGGQGHGTTAPEPGSLMLLSTGLFGIAGLVRRKFLRA
jgi:hypothetical protein